MRAFPCWQLDKCPTAQRVPTASQNLFHVPCSQQGTEGMVEKRSRVYSYFYSVRFPTFANNLLFPLRRLIFHFSFYPSDFRACFLRFSLPPFPVCCTVLYSTVLFLDPKPLGVCGKTQKPPPLFLVHPLLGCPLLKTQHRTITSVTGRTTELQDAFLLQEYDLKITANEAYFRMVI